MIFFFLSELIVSLLACPFHRQRPSDMMMKMTMILMMMTLATKKSSSHPSMRWMPLYSLSTQSEVLLYKIF